MADPYAEPDVDIQPSVDAALRVVCAALIQDVSPSTTTLPDTFSTTLRQVVPSAQVDGVTSSMRYLRDRIGVPRDLPLASARYLRAYLNWGIDTLTP